MKETVIVLVVLALAVVAVGMANESTTDKDITIPTKDKFHLYLLLGTSNMVGRNKIRQEDRRTHPRILMLDRDLSWVPAADPLPHEDSDKRTGVGPGMSFARTMVERDEHVTIGLVACAWGGTPIKRWSMGGDLFERAIKRTRAAQKAGTLKGILWQQGENDSYTKTAAQSYKAKLLKLIDNLRTELDAPNVPFVTSEICQFRNPRYTHYRIINETLMATVNEVPNVGFVKVEGLELSHTGDRAHIDTPSQIRIGKAYAAEMSRLLGIVASN